MIVKFCKVIENNHSKINYNLWYGEDFEKNECGKVVRRIIKFIIKFYKSEVIIESRIYLNLILKKVWRLNKFWKNNKEDGKIVKRML